MLSEEKRQAFIDDLLEAVILVSEKHNASASDLGPVLLMIADGLVNQVVNDIINSVICVSMARNAPQA